jgi:biopolymer transport protein ExbB
MLELLARGGPLMVPILLGSVTAVAVFLERLHALRRSRVVPKALGVRVREAVRAGDLAAARALCKDEVGAAARVMEAVLAAAGRDPRFVRERAEEVGRREAAGLERYVGVLGVVAAISPLLGLLGTVTGMISVFQKVVTEGVGDPRLLASGIWEALVTTAAGLTVAIPAYLAWRFLLARVRDLVLELEEEATALADLVAEPPAAVGERPAERGAAP